MQTRSDQILFNNFQKTELHLQTERFRSGNLLFKLFIFLFQKLPPGVKVHEFAPITNLPAHGSAIGTIGVDWNDSTQPLSFDVSWKGGSSNVTLKAPVGELVRAVKVSHGVFVEEQG